MRKLKQRLCSLLLCAALAVSLCPTAFAEDNVSYLDENGETKNCAKAFTVTANENTWSGDGQPPWYVASGSVEISSRVTVTGDVHLILMDGCNLTVNGGIYVGSNCSLTIYGQSSGEGMGKLTAKATNKDDPVIGGGGNITINGGTVEATGVSSSGIYGGGGVTISGGTVTATGSSSYGIFGYSSVTISGGTVTATGSSGYGIYGGSGITISGGEVEATGSSCGISGGSGVISITGGTVKASSGSIGNGIACGGTITISGSTVIASGGRVGISSDGSINVTDGEVTANGSDYGIVSYGGDGTITISGGTVTATGGTGIRGRGNMTISGGTVTATGTSGSNLGGGIIVSKNMTISGGTVTATGTAMGTTNTSSGYGIQGSNNTISGGTVTATGTSDSGSGIGIQGSSNTISGGTVTATGTSDSRMGIGIQGNNNMTISGGEVTATGTSGSDLGYGIQVNNNMIISGGTVTATGTSSTNSCGIHGTFSTETDGKAFIAASSISDQSGKDQWRGVIFVGTDNGKVYGSEITLATDATIPEGKTLEIEADKTLIIGEGVTLTNNGSITGNGTIINNGTIEGGTIEGSVTTHTGKTAWSSDASGHWHECAVEGCDQNHQFNKAAHTPGDWVIDKAATSTEAGQRHKACTVCGYVTATETIPATGGGSSGGGGGSYTPPTYKPEVERPGQGGGTPSISPSDPKRGDTVTVTPKPDEGYEVDKITVTDRSGKKVEVKADPDGTFSFTQPAGRVKIEVTYKAAEPVETPWSNPFADVPKDAWYYEAVRFVCERGLMNGYADGRFAPEDTLSRAQLAQILFNKEGQPGGSGQSDFTDVSGGAWYSAAVCWAADQGIVGGYGDGSFGPSAPITREQLAVMLWRYAGSPAAGGALDFADTEEISPFALEAMAWAVEQGVMNGYGDGQLGPKGQATRAQTAQMLMNFVASPGGNG